MHRRGEDWESGLCGVLSRGLFLFFLVKGSGENCTIQ
jgi:hypothetical protein